MQSVLRTALQDGVDEELFDANPLYGWKYTNKETPKPIDDVDPFDMSKQQAISNELHGQAKI